MFIQTPQDVLHDFRERFKSKRLQLNITQEGLAIRAGMSWSSLKRFERTGQISRVFFSKARGSDRKNNDPSAKSGP